MISSSVNRQIGSIFLIVGTEIGAGVLALPILISHVGVALGTLLLLFAWALMLYTALLVCEANSTLGEGVSFATMAGKFLGKSGKLFLTVIFWCTLSTIAMAYISAAGSTFQSMLHISTWSTSTVFVLIFGVCVVLGTKTVDYVNRILLSLKLGVFLLAILLLFNNLSFVNLKIHGAGTAIISSFPAIITAFILHNIIPSVRGYLKNDKVALRRVIIIGSLIPLLLYIFWVIAIIGNIPSHGANSFDLLFSKGNDANVGDLLDIISANTSSNLIVAAINFVATISVTTSFLGTSLSLYHFVQDLLGRKAHNHVYNTLLPIVLTFIIPLLIVIINPNIFIMALSYAGVGATILFVLIPVLIIKQMIKAGHDFSSSILHNQLILNLAFIIGLGVILIQFWSF